MHFFPQDRSTFQRIFEVSFHVVAPRGDRLRRIIIIVFLFLVVTSVVVLHRISPLWLEQHGDLSLRLSGCNSNILD